MPRTSIRLNANSLLSSGLLALLLCTYVALIYAAAAIGGALFAGLRDQGFNQPWWVNAIALALTAATIVPVARWLRGSISNLIYAQHDDPYVLVARVNQHLQSMTNPRTSLPVLAATIADALKLPYVAIETISAEAAVPGAFGTPPLGAAVARLPITYLDIPLGALLASDRAANQPLSAEDLILLRDVAKPLGIALRAAQLTADLQAARERLVITREEERRRIRNDLHDGLAPTLSSLQLQLGAMRTMIRPDPDQAEAIADELRADLRAATAEIRRLVYDLRPPMLDELGLVGAIRSFKLQTSQLKLEVRAPEPMPKLPAAAEVAAYRIASEAIHNVVKHAHASLCAVVLEPGEDSLVLSVTDNGASLPSAHHAGVGLHSMQERAAELGGTLTIQPGENGGTQVVARLPITG